MDWPDLLPKELAFCKKAKTQEGLLALLEEHSDETLIHFFEVAADDETWSMDHKNFIVLALQWCSQEFSQRRLRVDHGARVVSQIHKHSDILVPLLPRDIEIEVKDGQFFANTLLFGVQSRFFLELIERNYKKGKPLQLRFPDVSSEQFRVLLEGINYGLIETLWRTDYDQLLDLIYQAGQWQLQQVVQQCAEVIRRYVSEENVLELLKIAQAQGLPKLREVCCEELNSKALGVQFASAGDSELLMRIEEHRERNQKLVTDIAPLVTQLALSGSSGEGRYTEQLLRLCGSLRGLDISGSEGFNIQFIRLLPPLHMLDFSNCPWLTDSEVEQLLREAQGLRIILMNENPQLGMKAFRAVTQQPLLEELYCVYCSGLKDPSLETIARGCQALTDLSIAWCPEITDRGLAALGRFRSTLKNIDISHLTKITNAGLRDLTRPLQNLRSIIIQQLPLVTEDGVRDLLAFSPLLDKLDMRLCEISTPGLDGLRALYPQIHIIH